MGSSSGRKSNDIAVRTLKATKSESSTGAGAAGGQDTKSKSLSCPQTLKVNLPLKLKVGTSLQLKIDGNSVGIFDGKNNVGNLKSKQLEQMLQCISIGFTYTGIVEPGGMHANFRQSRT